MHPWKDKFFALIPLAGFTHSLYLLPVVDSDKLNDKLRGWVSGGEGGDEGRESVSVGIKLVVSV